MVPGRDRAEMQGDGPREIAEGVIHSSPEGVGINPNKDGEVTKGLKRSSDSITYTYGCPPGQPSCPVKGKVLTSGWVESGSGLGGCCASQARMDEVDGAGLGPLEGAWEVEAARRLTKWKEGLAKELRKVGPGPRGRVAVTSATAPSCCAKW